MWFQTSHSAPDTSSTVPAGKSIEEPQRDQKSLMTQAAMKRFRVKTPKIINNTGEKNIRNAKEKIAKAMMIEQLIREAMERDPNLLSEAKTNALKKRPLIYGFKQAGPKLETIERFSVIHNTSSCKDTVTPGSTFTAKIQALEDHCIDRMLDFPGGFHSEHPLEISVYEIDQVGRFENLDNLWSDMIRIELRKIVVERFLTHYRKTGSLRYDKT